MEDLSKLYEAVVDGRIDEAGALTNEALNTGHDASMILNQTLVPAMGEVGDRFERNEYFIPNMLIAAEAMKTAMEVLKPSLGTSGLEPVGSVAIGTVKGDLHDIGKNLVASMLEGNGFRVVNLGMDVEPEAFVNAVKEENVNIIAMSALLTTTMSVMKEVVEALKREGLRDRVKIIVGGAPITPEYAEEIGANGCSDNANGAVSLAKQLTTAEGEIL
jgi:5-methyltetrahydrofolate--homocysteine methyltransferase